MDERKINIKRRYNDNGDLISENHYEYKKGQEIAISKYIYTYTNKNLVSVEYYRIKGDAEFLVWKYKYLYDRWNRTKSESKYFYEKGREFLAWKFEY
jgi:hypothetical protein